jgi:gliding motility-associated-like protein
LTAEGSGGIAPYQYKMGSGAYQVSGTFNSLAAGSYTITIQDANLCTVDIPVTISQPATGITGNIVTQTNVTCFGSSDGTFTVEGSGGTAPYQFSLDGATFQASGIFNGLSAGTYTVTISDATPCTTDIQVIITEPEALSISFEKTDASCPGDADGSITLTTTGGTQPYSVIWSDGVLTATRTNIPTGTYSAVVTDINGCAASINVEISASGSEKCLVIPDIITPNNDGYNDTWIIKNIDLFPNAEVFIYTRWGKLVFKTRNLSANPWDGTYKGKLLPTDSYHYILHLNDGSEPRSGVISIIR